MRDMLELGNAHVSMHSLPQSTVCVPVREENGTVSAVVQAQKTYLPPSRLGMRVSLFPPHRRTAHNIIACAQERDVP